MIRHPGIFIRALCLAATTAFLLAAAGATAVAQEEENWPVSEGAKEAEAKAGDARNKAEIIGVCGPDITSNVMDVLWRIYERAKGWTHAQTKAKCDAMFWKYSTRKSARSFFPKHPAFDGWDIRELSPRVGEVRETGTAEVSGITPRNRPWFQGYAPYCARPRHYCAPTVEFLGQCMHSQVVNYVQWGLMANICREDSQALDLQKVYDFARADWAKLEASTRFDEEQIMMIGVGRKYSEHRLKSIEGAPRQDFERKAVRELENWVKEQIIGGGSIAAHWPTRKEKMCKITKACTTSQLKGKKFKYIWDDWRGGVIDVGKTEIWH